MYCRSFGMGRNECNNEDEPHYPHQHTCELPIVLSSGRIYAGSATQWPHCSAPAANCNFKGQQQNRGNFQERPRCVACITTSTQEPLPLSSMKERTTREGHPPCLMWWVDGIVCNCKVSVCSDLLCCGKLHNYTHFTKSSIFCITYSPTRLDVSDMYW
jgi:hypothetical protein